MNKPTESFTKKYSMKTCAKAYDEQCFTVSSVRFTVLTDRLLRVETGAFTDKATQAIICRRAARPAYKTSRSGGILTISTERAVFRYDLDRKNMLSVTPRGFDSVSDFEKGNLSGTCRTLDGVNGSTRLGPGLMSRSGVSVIDDSLSVLLNDDGTLSERPACSDKYYFAYGHDYRGCLKDFFVLCSPPPLVSRFCLGNWWSRYKAYTQKEYTELMQSFIDRRIPITVATIDMDWHWVDVDRRFGKSSTAFRPDKYLAKHPLSYFQGNGWTGYSWNTELFPNYAELLKYLHDNGFHTTLNLHPAQGVRPFEDMYDEMAKRMGLDPKQRRRIPFDMTDPKFIEAYFDVLHKPYEAKGVDFWWIDWQQGRHSAIKGLDPLWALNHYHTLAFNGENKRALILSRYAGIGSHRYPLGFSGDTIISWKSLDFQPYFTANAANIGYTWWSHDIGGHQLGKRDDELYARWVQLGCFSPINRLHSTSDEFMGKEPWKYSLGASTAAINALRQRHSLIPYIYSMNYRTHKQGIALCEPMYYSYPEQESAYKHKNQFFFGSELLVAPITEPADKTTTLAGVSVWLPDGVWTDIYNGFIYQGGQTVKMFRGLESIPVLARQGAIIPLDSQSDRNDCSNPKSLTVRIFHGDGDFTLYEDDGETLEYLNGKFAKTRLRQIVSGSDVYFSVYLSEGDATVVPEKRDYIFSFESLSGAGSVRALINGESAAVKTKAENGVFYVTICGVSPADRLDLKLCSVTLRQNTDLKQAVVERISRYQVDNMKRRIALEPFIRTLDLRLLPYRRDSLVEPIRELYMLKRQD